MVTGRVQGVGFRYYTMDAAGERGLDGWVRNRPDGSVEMEVQGTKEVIDLFLDDVREGPPLARVSDLLIRELPVKEGLSGFRISR